MVEDEKLRTGKHVLWKMALIIVSLPVLLLTMILNFLSATNDPVDALYVSKTSNISNKYQTALTPENWTFSVVWSLIYTWQLLHVFYSISLVFRKTKDGDYLYVKPGHIHFSFYIVFMINNCFNFGWIFLWDREYVVPAFVFLSLNTFTLYTCGVLVSYYLNKAGAELEASGNAKDIWLTRVFTLNGIAFYATWVTPASLLNFCVVLQYRGGVQADTCAWITVVILTIEVIAWFVLETFVFDRYIRYCFAPYIVLILALSGIVDKQYNASAPASYMIYLVILLSIVIVLTIVKIVIMFVKGKKHPVKYVCDKSNAAALNEVESE